MGDASGATMIRLTQHAATALLRRGLRADWIEAAILAPDWMGDPDPALTRSYDAIAARGGRVPRGVHCLDGGDILVVTARFDRSARP